MQTNVTIPNKDALEVKALELFKQTWQSFGFATTVPTGGDKMPRRFYAACLAAVVAQLQEEYQRPDCKEVLYSVLLTVLGNASQLGARLVKEGWLKEASAEQTADELLAKLMARQRQG